MFRDLTEPLIKDEQRSDSDLQTTFNCQFEAPCLSSIMNKSYPTDTNYFTSPPHNLHYSSSADNFLHSSPLPSKHVTSSQHPSSILPTSNKVCLTSSKPTQTSIFHSSGFSSEKFGIKSSSRRDIWSPSGN